MYLVPNSVPIKHTLLSSFLNITYKEIVPDYLSSPWANYYLKTKAKTFPNQDSYLAFQETVMNTFTIGSSTNLNVLFLTIGNNTR